jgi:nitrite reductase/ring-hydroxylating ferredoxin subunit
MAGRLLLAMHDPVVVPRIESLAAGLELELVTTDTPDTILEAEPPTAIVLELELPHAVERIVACRRRWAGTLLVGSIRYPDQELWHGALAAGADLVANRGALVGQLERALGLRSSRQGGLGDARDVVQLPVRLSERDGDGLVGRLPDAPGGAIAVFRLGDRLHAIRDECPHAGASLADGVLDGAIVTCPRHGSQFDLTTGSRERGPSDFPIRTYRVVSGPDGTHVEVPG